MLDHSHLSTNHDIDRIAVVVIAVICKLPNHLNACKQITEKLIRFSSTPSPPFLFSIVNLYTSQLCRVNLLSPNVFKCKVACFLYGFQLQFCLNWIRYVRTLTYGVKYAHMQESIDLEPILANALAVWSKTVSLHNRACCCWSFHLRWWIVPLSSNGLAVFGRRFVSWTNWLMMHGYPHSGGIFLNL